MTNGEVLKTLFLNSMDENGYPYFILEEKWKDLPYGDNPTWTPAAECPKEAGRYLVVRQRDKDFIIDIAFFNTSLDVVGEKGWYKTSLDSDYLYWFMLCRDVVAWQPLPKYIS